MKSVYIKDMLGSLGYSSEHFSENYAVQIDGTSAVRFDYVAFSDRFLKDISTSCIAVQEVRDDNEENRYIEGAKYLAVPIVIISKDNHVRVWNIAPQKTRLLKDNEENIIHFYFEKNRFEFMSDNLIGAKLGYKQLSIFEAVGLIDFSREATCKILSEEFEKGLTAAKRYMKTKKKLNTQDLNYITSITMHVISALIIHSKINPQEKVPDLFQLLTNLSKTYKEYFDDKLMLKYGKKLLDEIYGSLNQSINYQSVDHELLGYFYETTLLQLSEKKAEDLRKEYGIYYTPKIISREIVFSIPFENIPVDERYILDGTCGSGSLLLSACKRLEELVSYEMKEFDRHNYLTKMIEGYDIDKFASEVARLSFLLYSLPYGNKWNIHVGDLLQLGKSQVRTPNVILGNPPYKESNEKGQRVQKASEFLDKYLDWLHDKGYIGIILPASFLQNDSSVIQREKLLNEFDILELWMLPGHIFKNNCSTIVIIAQKKKLQTDNVTKIKILVRKHNLMKNYHKQCNWDFEFFVNIQWRWVKEKKFQMNISPVEDILQKIVKEKKTIRDITTNVTGIKIPSDYMRSKVKVDGWTAYIENAKNFRRYVISQRMQNNINFINYHIPEEEEREINADHDRLRLRRNYESIYYASNKVLVKMSSTPGEINCISAFVDEEGYYPSYSFFVIVSNDQRISNYVICALLNSKLINAFVRRGCVKRTLTTDTVRSIPVPEFSDLQIDEIEEYYLRIKKAYELDDEEKADEIQEQMDDIIFEAFQLGQEDRERIRKLFDIYSRNDEDLTSKHIEFESYHYVSGQVEEIDIERMCCSVYLVEFGEQEIQIETSMPGWFLRRGAEFSAKYYEGKLSDIRPLVYSYLDNEEVVELLTGEISE